MKIHAIHVFLQIKSLILIKELTKLKIHRLGCNTLIRNRFQLCKCCAKVNRIFWKDVIFSDESRLELFSGRRKYVHRPQGSRYNPRYTTKTVKFGRKSIMAWGAMKADGTRILIRCPDRMNSAAYEKVLKK